MTSSRSRPSAVGSSESRQTVAANRHRLAIFVASMTLVAPHSRPTMWDSHARSRVSSHDIASGTSVWSKIEGTVDDKCHEMASSCVDASIDDSSSISLMKAAVGANNIRQLDAVLCLHPHLAGAAIRESILKHADMVETGVVHLLRRVITPDRVRQMEARVAELEDPPGWWHDDASERRIDDIVERIGHVAGVVTHGRFMVWKIADARCRLGLAGDRSFIADGFADSGGQAGWAQSASADICDIIDHVIAVGEITEMFGDVVERVASGNHEMGVRIVDRIADAVIPAHLDFMLCRAVNVRDRMSIERLVVRGASFVRVQRDNDIGWCNCTDFLEFCRSHGMSEFDKPLIFLVGCGRADLGTLDWCVANGARVTNTVMVAATCDVAALKWCAVHVAGPDFEWMLRAAAIAGHTEAMEFAVAGGASDFEQVLWLLEHKKMEAKMGDKKAVAKFDATWRWCVEHRS